MNEAANDAWRQAIMWHGVEMLPRLRRLSPEERMRVMQQANQHNLTEPLWLAGDKRKFSVPAWEEKPLSGAQVTALLVFGLWVQVGEREEAAPSLFSQWPEIKTAAFLASQK